MARGEKEENKKWAGTHDSYSTFPLYPIPFLIPPWGPHTTWHRGQQHEIRGEICHFSFVFYFSIDFSFLCRIWWFAESFNSRERERGEAKVDAPPCCRANMPPSYSVWLFLLPLWTILLQGMLVLLCSCSSYTLI